MTLRLLLRSLGLFIITYIVIFGCLALGFNLAFDAGIQVPDVEKTGLRTLVSSTAYAADGSLESETAPFTTLMSADTAIRDLKLAQITSRTWVAANPATTNAPSGTVTVVNRTVIPLQITDVRDTPLAQIAPFRSQILKTPVGRTTLRARRLDGSLYLEAVLFPKARGATVWDILPNEAVLEVHNKTTRDLTIEVDGAALADVKAGDTLRVDGIRPGSRFLSAKSGSDLLATRAADFATHDTFLWELGQAGHADVGIPILRVRNFSGRVARIFVNGDSRITLNPADSAALVGIKPGHLELEARAVKSNEVIAKNSLEVTGGQVVVWEVAGPEGGRATVEVRNKTAEMLKVCVDGSFCIRVKQGAVVQYDALTPGRHTFEAWSFDTDRLIEALEANRTGGKPYQWDVSTAE